MKGKHLMLSTLIALVLLIVAFTPISSQQGNSYDPWLDYNDDGRINYKDLYELAIRYGASGTPINKTALLLELQSRIDTLNASLLDLEAYLKTRITNLEASLVELQSKVTDLETRIPKKGYVSISPGAFTPAANGTKYWIGLSLGGGPGWAGFDLFLQGWGYFFAQVDLPHGAKVLNMTVCVTDELSDFDISIGLTRRYIGSMLKDWTENWMAWVKTVGTPGQDVLVYDDTINYAEVDNQHYSYFLYAIFLTYHWQLRLKGVVIEYEYQA